MASQSLKVPVTALIEKAEAERARIVAAHAKAMRRPVETASKARIRLASEMVRMARALTQGKLKPDAADRYDRKSEQYLPVLSLTASVRLPEPRPDGPADTADVDRDLRLLRSTSQETVSVRLDSNFARYL